MNTIRRLRNRYFLLLDVLVILLAPIIALSLRLDRLNWGDEFGRSLLIFTIAALVVKLPTFFRLGMYRRYWIYASPEDLAPIMLAVGIPTAVLTIGFLAARNALDQAEMTVPRTLPLLDGILTFMAVAGPVQAPSSIRLRLRSPAAARWMFPRPRTRTGRS